MGPSLITQGFGADPKGVLLQGYNLTAHVYLVVPTGGSSQGGDVSYAAHYGPSPGGGMWLAGVAGITYQPLQRPTLRRAIAARLNGLSAVTALVSTRIWPLRPPQSWVPSSGPCLTFDVTSEEFEPDLDGVTSTGSAEVEIRAISLVLGTAEDVINAVLAAFPALGTTSAGLTLDAILAGDESDSFDYLPDGGDTALPGISQTFTILYQRG